MTENYITRFETEAPQCDAPALREKKPPGDFGANLRRLRWERDLSIRQVANACNFAVSTLERYEQGVSRISINNLYRLCQFFHVSADEMLCYTKRRRENVR